MDIILIVVYVKNVVVLAEHVQMLKHALVVVNHYI